MLDFFKSLFKPQGSGATAKERLRLVLLSDHLSLSPDMIEALKSDLFGVFSRYFEYDVTQAEVTFDHREREVAMLASVPILRVRDRIAGPEPVIAASEAVAVTLQPAPPITLEEAGEPSGVVAGAPELPADAPVAAARPRKRRRRRNAAANGAPPSPQSVGAGHSAQA